ncbi:MAG: GNAT family N-acetyltransferase [Chloroflexi bacterium]|nr:GNAT family N-acetyltransferase [Chloroflexota bacterium]MBT3670187.1 GNAT family N-acetyltransferase [Chloroflexota bacterium]MBT4004057.1 GNAT family N-acetyltransferase [Chloroflexota bacterium]MBT4306139.1 GNAT family N-acetyltransferase [Chloroflexota bacterium]MBT4534519.1 GNAT family N-acetyltransferase [Chloroflexota bacterium]
MMVEYKTNLTGIDWKKLKSRLKQDTFDNGRTAEELELSFKNSYAICFAVEGDRIVGKVRVLSDGVCNAYIVDTWTDSEYRNRGIASRMMEKLLEKLAGQHVYLFTDDSVAFYKKLGFRARPTGLELVVGNWLNR